MSNHEAKEFVESVDIFMAFQRTKFTDKHACIRTVVKDFDRDLAFLEAKLKVIGGEWRIHKTVNKRDIEKARKWLLKHLIDHPEKASFVDSLWRTALLQPDCVYGEKRFMFDVDTKVGAELKAFETLVENGVTQTYERDIDGTVSRGYIPNIEKYETPKGWHYITYPFDTRAVCELEYVTLLRDGYYYIKTVGGINDRSTTSVAESSELE